MKSKICLILPCNLYVIPYFKVYENMFNEMGITYDIITWNRSLIKEECAGNIISYDIKDIANNKDVTKIWKYIGFYKFVRKTITNHDYEKLVFLDTSACTLVLLNGFLAKYYKNRYWVDIRDYSFENFWLYKKMLETALKNSFCYDISSRGFLEFLPHVNGYCVTHNIDRETINRVKRLSKISDDAIRISFIGNVRYYDLNVELVEAFKNDNRFRLQFYGTESEKIHNYCVENKIFNVDFEGRFPYENTALFYQKTDVINNIYGNETMEVSTALSNKLYYSAYLNKPILVSNHTYMSELVTQYDLGFVVDFDSGNLADRIYDWYIKRLTKENNKRIEFIKIVENEFRNYQNKFRSFILLKG